ncbi:MAG: serine hydrolase [Lachnospiraceae bacterium]|nr:serine hydrolase [Lachnospiraceae bacterium]
MFRSRFISFSKKSISVKLLTVITCFSVFLCCVLPSFADDYDYEYLRNLSVNVEGSGLFNVKYIDMYYDHDSYVSLRDMAVALSGTDAKFDLLIEKDGIRFTKGGSYTPVGGEGSFFSVLTRDPSSEEYVRKRNYFNLDGSVKHYYTFLYKDEETGYYDCYMYLSDLILILGKDVSYSGSTLNIDPSAPLSIDPDHLEDSGFFLATNAVLLGDATNGEIYYSYNPDISVPMASTTKLMSYIVAMDAVSSGSITLSSVTETSENVQKLSHSIDRGFYIKSGSKVTIEELIYAMLLPSNNECTLALAEAVAGSEEAFVKRMNDKAAAIGLSEGTEFFTCNGLPVYTEEAFRGKIQNHITANDMFKLVCYLISTYPQITDITSTTAKYLPSFDRTVYNTNSMLYNVPGCIGLKTGTTNKAGCCLVSAIASTGDNGTHTICCIELGAEDIVTRNNVTQTMLSYGDSVFKNGGASSIQTSEGAETIDPEDLYIPVTGSVPENADELARLIVWTAKNHMPIPEPDLVNIPEEEPGD